MAALFPKYVVPDDHQRRFGSDGRCWANMHRQHPEKRLERGWQDLLPILVSAIRREFGV
jgi:hypothetical protein